MENAQSKHLNGKMIMGKIIKMKIIQSIYHLVSLHF